MEQIKEDLQHVYNLSVESFNKKEYSAFFRNIRPGIEYLSQFLIYDFFGNEDEAEDLINGDTIPYVTPLCNWMFMEQDVTLFEEECVLSLIKGLRGEKKEVYSFCSVRP